MKHIIWAYGTLRPKKTEPIKIQGTMYDLGWFPGVKLGGPLSFLAERIEVDNLAAVDRYEGYYENDPQHSLYVREPYLDGFIYVYNQPISSQKIVPGGDWLLYKNRDGYEHFS